MLDVFHSLQKTDLFEKFKLQLHKDYELAGFDTYSPKISSNNLDAITDEILNSLLKIEKASSTGIQNLLYRIDISEKQIHHASQLNTQLNFNQVITELIIKRTLQKVILKQHYSSS